MLFLKKIMNIISSSKFKIKLRTRTIIQMKSFRIRKFLRFKVNMIKKNNKMKMNLKIIIKKLFKIRFKAIKFFPLKNC